MKVLVLPGGGSRGAFQAGAMSVIWEKWRPHVVCGISVGGLNGAMLCQDDLMGLEAIWRGLEETRIHSGGIGVRKALSLLLGRSRSVYDNAPLKGMIYDNVDPIKFTRRLIVGYVALGGDGRFHKWDSMFDSPRTCAKSVLASATLPMLWEPVEGLPHALEAVDGGISVVSPMKMASDLNPTEIMVVHTHKRGPEYSEKHKNIKDVGSRTIELMMHHSLRKDVGETERINAIVNAAGGSIQVGDRVYKYFNIIEVFPEDTLGDSLDFSNENANYNYDHGIEVARRLGW